MYVEANIYAGNATQADEIPRRAFLNDHQVYIVKDSFLVKSKPYIIKENKNTVVVKGLPDGTLVVVEPIPGAVDSMKVAPITNK